MAGSTYQIRRCIRPGCEFRFPAPVSSGDSIRCPRCRASTLPAGEPYDSLGSGDLQVAPSGSPLELVLDNLRSTFNVGAIFRSADGAGVRHIHLCGTSPTPEHAKVGKTALGAEQSVAWTYHRDLRSAVLELQNQKVRVWALEGGPRAESLFHAAAQQNNRPIALIVGNEVSGVEPGVLDLCEKVVAIPMSGVKESLNVAIACGIAMYAIRFNLRTPDDRTDINVSA